MKVNGGDNFYSWVKHIFHVINAVFDDAVIVTYVLIIMCFSLAVSRDDIRTETTSTERTPLAASQDDARSERTFMKKGEYTVHMQPNSKKKGM